MKDRSNDAWNYLHHWIDNEIRLWEDVKEYLKPDPKAYITALTVVQDKIIQLEKGYNIKPDHNT